MTTILRRLLQLIPTLLGVAILTFAMMRLTPGDPVKLMLGPEATEEGVNAKKVELGFKKYIEGTEADMKVAEVTEEKVVLDFVTEFSLTTVEGQPLMVHIGDTMHPSKAEYDGHKLTVAKPPVKLTAGESVKIYIGRELVDRHLTAQFLSWLWGVVRLDWGTSISSKLPVRDEILHRLPATIELAFVSMFFALVTGLVVGIFSSVYPRTFFDNVLRIVVFIFLAMPGFWLGLELIILFSRTLYVFPPAGRGDPWKFSMLKHLILPGITLGVGTGALLSRILRSSMLQVLNTDYIRTAKAKGLSGKGVVLKHALKNAMIPFVTVAGLSLGSLLGGSVIVETVFEWPGIRKLLIDSILAKDYPVTMGCVLILSGIFVIVNLVVDLLYMVLDPRIRLEDSGAN